jgi:hypothetical protein
MSNQPATMSARPGHRSTITTTAPPMPMTAMPTRRPTRLATLVAASSPPVLAQASACTIRAPSIG